ncbi:GNAT family N-acetyltransferase [Enterovibrio coralii]|uniref:GNAT family N-acetyltransferase n=1 Tax=Enterovibrio coralii TaxID=294935 RepID=UPI0018DBC273|nr:GNAT family N-acetyltransferase [Enterovibrio coralii]
MIKIEKASPDDIQTITALVKRVAAHDVLPHFSAEGKAFFLDIVLRDVKTTFENASYHTFKLVDNDKLVGFSALREGNYLTHLFVDKCVQGKGWGAALLTRTFSFATSDEVTMRASVNAVPFYEKFGCEAIREEEEVNGIRFVNMRYTLKS